MSIQTICKSSCSEHWLEVQAPSCFRDSDDSCPVCTESTIGDIVKTICGHSYHSECLLNWHKSQVKVDKEESSCPMCTPSQLKSLERWTLKNLNMHSGLLVLSSCMGFKGRKIFAPRNSEFPRNSRSPPTNQQVTAGGNSRRWLGSSSGVLE